jgi:hypothetical protein
MKIGQSQITPDYVKWKDEINKRLNYQSEWKFQEQKYEKIKNAF